MQVLHRSNDPSEKLLIVPQGQSAVQFQILPASVSGIINVSVHNKQISNKNSWEKVYETKGGRHKVFEKTREEAKRTWL